jgi:ubiquinone/menaquinone biosynthesis C-methylase UbiE
MDNRLFAKHLKNPEGEVGKAVGIVMNKTNEYMNRYTYKNMNVSLDDELLEIGFGNGKFIPELFENDRKFKYTGIEISKVMLEEAQKNIPANIKDNVNLLKASIDNIEFEDSSFDKICAINAMYFWNKPIDYLKEIKRVLKPGGELFICIRSKEVMERQEFAKYYFRLYSYGEINKMLVDLGFSNIKLDNQIEPDNPLLDVLLISCSKLKKELDFNNKTI